MRGPRRPDEMWGAGNVGGGIDGADLASEHLGSWQNLVKSNREVSPNTHLRG